MVRKPSSDCNFDGADSVSIEGASAKNPASPTGGDGSRASEIKVMEVDAFSSVHDMIHAAIVHYGTQATLRQVYQACEERGRIAYKRSGGSRLITHNDHWKSQIRHALYTCDRFQRVTEGADLWMISPGFQHVQPQTTKVLIRSDSNAGGSISDESLQEQGRRQQPQQRQTVRPRHPAPPDPPFLAASQRRKRTSRQAMAQATSPAKRPLTDAGGSASPFTARSEQNDECSHIDQTGLALQPRQARVTPPPASSQMDCTVAPSPHVRMGGAENGAWQRAARRLNSELNGASFSVEDKHCDLHYTGSDDETGPSATHARSAEAESPASTQQLYALRSRSKPPPGFGDNPDPAAERAAREAQAMTTGPLKKRLKAAAKAAEMAVTAASAVNEEATSTHTEMGTGRIWRPSPSIADGSCNTGKPPVAWRPAGDTLPPLVAPAQNLRSRGRGRGMRLIDQVTAQPTHGASLSSFEEAGATEQPRSTPHAATHSETPSETQCLALGATAARHASARGAVVFQQGGDAEEGADETDEGGGKRLLRSHAAAAAADLERDGTLDRTDWRG